MSAPAKQTAGTAPVDTITMRETVVRALGSEGETDAPPPTPENLDILIGQLRGHLELLIPEVEQMLARLPKDGT
ncbi:DUF6415 family natural product biosynthesis protein, partial [Kitasatospora sp. NPDC094028]